MLYSTSTEKELFQVLIPEIDKVKQVFKSFNLSNSNIESDLIQMINNEIHYRGGGLQNPNNLSSKMYLQCFKKTNNNKLNEEIKKIIKQILEKCDRFEKEYIEKV